MTKGENSKKMLSKRQEQILKVIVEEYTKTVQPVGSKTIMSFSQINASSATIRNDCVELEKNGYLEKEHVSSGRVPSTVGYRYYVDHLMKNIGADVDDIKTRLEILFANRNMAIEEVLNKTSEILSEMTKLTSLVIGPSLQQAELKKIELLPINDYSAVVVFILSNGHVENKMFNFSEVSMHDLQTSITLFNDRLQNANINDLVERFDLIRPVLKQQVQKYEYILHQFAQAITSLSKPFHTTHGIQYMLENPEYNNPERIKETIKFIESISPFDFYLKKQNSNGNDIVVRIGNEINSDIDDVALLSTTYNVGNQEQGSIALVGPKRLEYDKVYEILEWITKKINENYKK